MSTPRSSTGSTPVVCRMLRSPSHESVTTDLSLFSVSSVSEALLGRHHRFLSFKSNELRGSSPNPDGKLRTNRPADIPEIIWFEEEGHDLIKSCGALSSALGIQKSFSTSDISQILLPESQTNALRLAVSELALNSIQRCGYLLDHPRLEQTSRSCSTWVAVGELASTSQLPSPHGGQTNVPSISTNTPPTPAFTAADLIRSVNKKVRQNYIRRRLLTTYRALERLSLSEFNLDRLEASALAATASNLGPGPTELVVPNYVSSSTSQSTVLTIEIDKKNVNVPSTTTTTQQKKKITINLNKNLTIHDIENERGKPLSKYERNMMIFNWLHSLDQNTVGEDLP